MILHKESVMLERETARPFPASFPEKTNASTLASSQWSLHVEGDLNEDDPSEAITLLHDLQKQVDAIRKAYSQGI
ncbi:MAG: hypothetical protein LBL73_09770 [Synergistaceae bacterium]|jgi:hypothetical protein|nr:hypothetical protein [Synergistaceae bacterium]